MNANSYTVLTATVTEEIIYDEHWIRYCHNIIMIHSSEYREFVQDV